ncbi:hypothetical protein [Burkholderia sp. BDU5]|uniref:hypothetical protein n=1 Tax=Burkholderia sp. BDU5 TaxID=1385590 RepID=UPI0012E3A3C9|nr:hypothetical protein [Burkholderia sp. BDU5]
MRRTAVRVFSLFGTSAHATSIDIAWRPAVCGGGFGLFQSPYITVLMAAQPQERTAAASGIITTARLIGQTTGAAFVAACFTAAGATVAIVALWVDSAFAGVACCANFVRMRHAAEAVDAA